MIFRIQMADRIIEVHSLYEEIQKLCGPYLCTENDTAEPDITITVTEEDIRREEEAVHKESLRTGIRRFCTPEDLETTAVYRKITAELAALDTFLMHGAVVATAGQGYMITAPSGVGKTTRLRLWTESIANSFVINGDKPLLKREDSIYRAYGTPWCGKEGWNTNASVPLRAIFLLSRADNGRENRVQEMPFPEAFPQLLHQTHLPDKPEARRRVLNLLRSMAGKVSVYNFHSELTVEAVRMAWETARPVK